MPQNNKGIRNRSATEVTGCELEKSDSILGNGTDFSLLCYIQNGIEFDQTYSNICIQQDTAIHNLFYPENALHVSGDTLHHHQERKRLYLQHLIFVVSHPQHTQTNSNSSAIAADSNNSVTNTR
jgi:hypothetical protein